MQRWLWEQGWTDLRDAQAAALLLILAGERDVVIAAATASGKTEAAFLPLLTRLHQAGGQGVVLYIAPVKALINDQSGRIGQLCERMELPVTPWHGDSRDTLRRRFLAAPRGIALITPESLESLLFRRGADLATIFATLVAVVVDELHAFIGNERGRQLQSLLHRLEEALARMQDATGLLLHGPTGEKRVNHFAFFAAFPDTAEYRLFHAGKALGTLPLSNSLAIGNVLIFTGRRWQVAMVDHDKRRNELMPAQFGQLPRTGGTATPVHDRVREEMRRLLADNAPLAWLDPQAEETLRAAQTAFDALGLGKNAFIARGESVLIFPWRGDRVHNGLAALLRQRGLRAENRGICIAIERSAPRSVADVLVDLATEALPDAAELVDPSLARQTEKWNWALPDRLNCSEFAATHLDLVGAKTTCAAMVAGIDKVGAGRTASMSLPGAQNPYDTSINP